MKIFPIHKSIIILSAILVLVACKPTKIPFLDKVLTVSEFSEQIQLRDKVVEYCKNNRGELGDDPNCINAIDSAKLDFTHRSSDPIGSDMEKNANKLLKKH